MAKYGVGHLVHWFVDPPSLLALSDSSSATDDAVSAARALSAKMGETQVPRVVPGGDSAYLGQESEHVLNHHRKATGSHPEAQIA